MKIIRGDCIEYLRRCDKYDMVFADPPDNLGLGYDDYPDKMPLDAYYNWLELLMAHAIGRARKVFWLSYYWQHDIEIKGRLRSILRISGLTGHKAKTFIWRYTFGQHNSHDFGSGFRFLLRVTSPTWTVADLPRVESERMKIGDVRANPEGRVPDDVWDYIMDVPRVVGNAKERRAWHPTQHPEALLERIIMSSVVRGSSILDCFLGTGTTMRVAKRLERDCDGVEISEQYCKNTGLDLGVPVVRWGDDLA